MRDTHQFVASHTTLTVAVSDARDEHQTTLTTGIHWPGLKIIDVLRSKAMRLSENLSLAACSKDSESL